MLQTRTSLVVRNLAGRPLARWAGALLTAALLPSCSSLYVSGAVGSVSTDVSSLESPNFDGEVDDSDSAFGAGLGLSLFKFLSVEFNYMDLGEFTWDGTYAGFPNSGVVETQGLSVAAVGHLPLGDRFELLGMAGLFAWQYDAVENDNGLIIDDDDAGVDPMYGVGFQARLIGSLSARLEYNRVDIDEETADVVLFRLLYSF